MSQSDNCINCGQPLALRHGTPFCRQCNSEELSEASVFLEQPSDDQVFIECPGATLYAPGTNEVIAGVSFHDRNDPFKGFKIIGDPVYAPNHKRRRRIKREALGRITRCQACQDYTIRMRRKEGPDFFIPSPKHPHRKKLKSVKHLSYEP